jgi:uncharacterized iron-regulated protein
MKRFILPLFLLHIVLIGLPFAHDRARSDTFLRVSDGAEIALAEVVNDLKGVRLVFVGERHDQKHHHEVQLSVIRAINEAGIPSAVGLEMFRKENQEALDRWVSGDVGEGEFERIYHENWNYPWGLYQNIFLYAQRHKIPLIGLNVPRHITRQVAQQGFSSLTAEQVGALPEVSCNVDRPYMEFIQRSFGEHPHGDMEFIYFCEAQIVWDTAMAWHLLSFLQTNPDSMVVVLAGNGHAWKRGIPEQIRRRSDIPYRVILPEDPERLKSKELSIDDLDYLWLGM